MAVLIGFAELLVFIHHGHPGVVIGIDHDESIVDLVRQEKIIGHKHHRTAEIGPVGVLAGLPVYSALNRAIARFPGGIGLLIRVAAAGIGQIPAQPAVGWRGFAGPNLLLIISGAVTLCASVDADAAVQRNDKLQLCAVAVLAQCFIQ